jgi:hypothetical protein
MVGEIRVIDEVRVEKASQVSGPYASSTEAKVSYPERTVSFPTPGSATFWRLNSTVPLRIMGVEVKSSSILLKFE